MSKPEDEFAAVVESAAQQLADSHLINANSVDWKVSERAMEIARQKREQNTAENQAQDYQRNLSKMNNAEYAKEMRDKFGIW